MHHDTGPGSAMTGRQLLVGTVPFTYLDDALMMYDTAEHPMTVHVELHVEGRLDPRLLRFALAEAAQRHPLARARVLPARATDRHWSFQVERSYQLDPLTEVDCPTERRFSEARETLLNSRVPTDRPPLFRVLLAHHPQGDRLVFAVHHCVGDGIGVTRFLRSVQRAYAGEEDPDAEVEFPAARDLERLLAIPDRGERQRRRLARRQSLWETARIRTCLLAGDGGSPGSHAHGIMDVQFTPAEEEAVRSRRLPDTTLNDVLITAHQLTYQEWNRRHGQTPDRVGTLMTLNCRPQAFQNDVLGNYSLYGVVATRPEERRDFESALRAVASWTADLKRTEGAAIQVDLEALGRLPVGVKRLIGRFAPARIFEGVLSNIGRLDDFGEFDAEAGRVVAIRFSPPVPAQAMGFVACGLGDRIFISARYRRALLDDQAAAAVVALFRHVLLEGP